MKAYLVWLKTEFKRVAQRLPSLFIGVIVLTLLVSAASFCALITAQIRGEKQQVGAKVALVAPEDNLTQLAVSFVSGMESVKDWCSFERCTLEDGLAALEASQVVAVIELPEDMLASILDGRNIPAKLYLPAKQTFGGTLLEIMAESGISLLQVAQGEIYATTDLYYEYPMSGSLGELYNEINLYNLDLVINREQIFKEVTLSETGGLSVGAYYGATAISLISLLFGLLLADFMLEYTGRERLLHLRNVSLGAQVIGRWKALTGVNFLWSFFMLLLLRIVLRTKEGIGMNIFSCIRESLYLLLAVACVTAICLLLGNLFRDKMPYMFGLGTGVFACGYLSGYFAPTGLLGQRVKDFAMLLPTTYLHRICSSVLAGQEVGQNLKKEYVLVLPDAIKMPMWFICLFGWLVLGLLGSILLRGRRQFR